MFLFGGGIEIYDNLGGFLVDLSEFVEGFAGLRDDFYDHEGGEHTVASGFAGEDDVTGLFPAEVDMVF